MPTETLFPILSIILNKRTYTNKRDCKKGQMENTVRIENTSGIRTYFSNVIGHLRALI